MSQDEREPGGASERRVREFLRQWAMMRAKSDDIYGVYADVNAEMATLRASDLEEVLNELERNRRTFRSLMNP